jgi:hypothetical protein
VAPRKAPGSFEVTLTDAPTRIGKALIAVLKVNPELSEPLVRLVQEKAGPHLTLGLINALSDADIRVGVTQQKRELTEEEKERRRENLKKAREAKQAKTKPKEEK